MELKGNEVIAQEIKFKTTHILHQEVRSFHISEEVR
jgi:hypothetical protein